MLNPIVLWNVNKSDMYSIRKVRVRLRFKDLGIRIRLRFELELG